MVKLWIVTRSKTWSSFVYHLTTKELNNNGQSHQVVEGENIYYLPKGNTDVVCKEVLFYLNECSFFQHIILEWISVVTLWLMKTWQVIFFFDISSLHSVLLSNERPMKFCLESLLQYISCLKHV